MNMTQETCKIMKPIHETQARSYNLRDNSLEQLAQHLRSKVLFKDNLKLRNVYVRKELYP